MLAEISVLVFAIIIIVLTAEISIRSSLSIAGRYGLSDSFIGLTVLSVGTSLPEIFTAFTGAIKIIQGGSKEISYAIIGTNVGSDIFQQTFVLGLVAFLFPIKFREKTDTQEIKLLIGATALLLILCLDGILSKVEGLALMLLYLLLICSMAKNENRKTKQKTKGLAETLRDSSILLSALIIMGIAADNALNAIQYLVVSLGISATFLGAITLGIASALPELTTAITAAIRGRRHISEGTLIGSNITNPMFGLGLGAAISSLHVPHSAIIFDMPYKLLCAFLLYSIIKRKGDISRVSALTLIFLYVTYLSLRSVFLLHA